MREPRRALACVRERGREQRRRLLAFRKEFLFDNRRSGRMLWFGIRPEVSEMVGEIHPFVPMLTFRL
jgi:hypothetical protein